MTEIWKPVVGFEAFYEVSSLGKFWNKRTGRPLAIVNRGRYLAVSFKAAPRKVLRSAHAAVAEAFIGPRPVSLEVAHLNGNPHDNRIENLAYVTCKENTQHKKLHGTSRGDLHDDQAQIIRKIVASGIPQTDLAKLLNVSDSVICKVVNAHNYK